MAGYYKILEVPRNATTSDIKKAYKKLALQWHPDKNHNSELANKRFREIAEAYEVLSDINKRAIYDKHGKDGLFNSNKSRKTTYYKGSSRRYKFTNPEEIFREFFGDSFFNSFFSGYNDYSRCKSKDSNSLDVSYTSSDSLSSSVSSSECSTIPYYSGTATYRNRGRKVITRTTFRKGKQIVTTYVNNVLVSKIVNGVPEKIRRTR